MKKIVLGGAMVVLAVYLGFVLVGQVFPYVQWLFQKQEEVRLEFASVEDMLQSGEVLEAVKEWVRLPGAVPEEARIAGVEVRDDGLTSPQIIIRYEMNGSRYMNYSTGGNYDLPTHRKLKSVPLGGIEGELLVGRDNTIVIKWRDPEGPPYRYLYYYDPDLTEEQMVDIAASVQSGATT